MLPRPSSEPDLASIALSTGRVSGDSDRLKLQELKFTSVATSTLQIFLGLFSKTFPILLVVTLLSKMDFFTSAASLLSNTFLQQLSKVLASTVGDSNLGFSFELRRLKSFMKTSGSAFF